MFNMTMFNNMKFKFKNKNVRLSIWQMYLTEAQKYILKYFEIQDFRLEKLAVWDVPVILQSQAQTMKSQRPRV